MARWEDVLDMQLDVHRWLTGPYGQDFGGGYFLSTFRNEVHRNPEDGPQWKSEEEAEDAGVLWAKAVGVTAFNAEPIWIDPDMMTVIESAIDRFKPEPLEETDLITKAGFMVLPRSLWLKDRFGKKMSWRVAVWAPASNGIHLTLLHDSHDVDDVDTMPEATNQQEWLRMSGSPRYLPTHVVNWDFGHMHPAWQTAEDIFEGSVEVTQEAHAQLQATWRLMAQFLAVYSKQRPPRQAVKRARAQKLPEEHVTIVRLRRPPAPRERTDDHIDVDWQRRWIVGGHWRNQWYPGLNTHRQIWISPYVKGPEDKPLIVAKTRIFEFVR